MSFLDALAAQDNVNLGGDNPDYVKSTITELKHPGDAYRPTGRFVPDALGAKDNAFGVLYPKDFSFAEQRAIATPPHKVSPKKIPVLPVRVPLLRSSAFQD